MDWLAKIVDAYKTRRSHVPARPSFREGASEQAIARLEESLACRLPTSLRSLLSQTDGITEEIQIEPDRWVVASVVIYSVDEMADNNLFMRREYADRNVDRYCFFSTAGFDGIQIGFCIDSGDCNPATVIAWYPDETADKCMGSDFLHFLTDWCAGRATV